MTIHTADLLSPLGRADCTLRLRRSVSSEWSLIADSGVVGRIDGDIFRLRKKIYYRNSFQRYVYGTMSDAPGGGTRIHCEAREMDLKWILIAAGVVAAFAMLGVLVAFLRVRTQTPAVPLALWLAPLAVIPILAAAGALAVYLGRWAARNEEDYLLAFLRRTLDVKDVA